ncbi:hypothetical protein IW261DRAFT_1470620 [Armillaria novae-zelandiae]|uniref:Uncharacterized protein n=1 Tax=Armillaria novae-zelandiae TaxID=153914 RepID=A0AA39PBZ3_9AGAR|nr:hypothetical protein IW261DRAFT_1470620 [Armillaria novae-zelandiae]
MQVPFIVVLLSIVFVLAGPLPSELNGRTLTGNARQRVDEDSIASRRSGMRSLPLKREFDMDVPAAMGKLADGAAAYSFK